MVRSKSTIAITIVVMVMTAMATTIMMAVMMTEPITRLRSRAGLNLPYIY
jgi:hypothetical protein